MKTIFHPKSPTARNTVSRWSFFFVVVVYVGWIAGFSGRSAYILKLYWVYGFRSMCEVECLRACVCVCECVCMFDGAKGNICVCVCDAFDWLQIAQSIVSIKNAKLPTRIEVLGVHAWINWRTFALVEHFGRYTVPVPETHFENCMGLFYILCVHIF